MSLASCSVQFILTEQLRDSVSCHSEGKKHVKKITRRYGNKYVKRKGVTKIKMNKENKNSRITYNFSILTYWLTHSMVQDILLKADSHLACQTVAFLYRNRQFITVFTKARHRILSWANRIQLARSIPDSVRSILILSSHLRLGLPSGLLLLGPSQPKPCKHLSPPPCVPHVQSTSSSLI
jgi:hypothetical protein